MMLLIGLGFALGYAALNVQATAGVSDHEQGLAAGLVQTSFQMGGADRAGRGQRGRQQWLPVRDRGRPRRRGAQHVLALVGVVRPGTDEVLATGSGLRSSPYAGRRRRLRGGWPR